MNFTAKETTQHDSLFEEPTKQSTHKPTKLSYLLLRLEYDGDLRRLLKTTQTKSTINKGLIINVVTVN